jgi:hypothetical protein
MTPANAVAGLGQAGKRPLGHCSRAAGWPQARIIKNSARDRGAQAELVFNLGLKSQACRAPPESLDAGIGLGQTIATSAMDPLVITS